MKPFHTLICTEDSEFARCLAYILHTKKTADPQFPTERVYAIMLRVLQHGTMIRFEDEEGAIIGVVCYTIGTDDEGYEDRHVAYVEYCLAPSTLHGTRFFMKCLKILIDTIQERNPEAVCFMLEADADHRHNNRLYSKFAKLTNVAQDDERTANRYTASMADMRDFLAKFS